MSASLCISCIANFLQIYHSKFIMSCSFYLSFIHVQQRHNRRTLVLSCEFAKINGCPDYLFVFLPPFFMRAFLPTSIFLTPGSLADIHWEWMLSHILNVLRFLNSLYVLNTVRSAFPNLFRSSWNMVVNNQEEVHWVTFSNFQVMQKGFSNRTLSTSLPILIMFFFCFAVPMIENLDATLRQGQVPMPQQITSPQPMPNFSNIELPSSVNLPSVTSKEASAVQLTSAGSIHSVNASETPHVVPPVSISSAPTTLSKFLTSLSTFHLNPHFCVLFGYPGLQ